MKTLNYYETSLLYNIITNKILNELEQNPKNSDNWKVRESYMNYEIGVKYFNVKDHFRAYLLEQMKDDIFKAVKRSVNFSLITLNDLTARGFDETIYVEWSKK